MVDTSPIRSQNSARRDWSWPYWPLLPLYPYGQRRTLRREIVPHQIWSFEQVQGIFYVVVPIRMTVVKLEAGGLLVYAPIAPTLECIRLLRELEARYGEVKYIILPTVSGLEHKVFVAPFARQCPQAQVFVAPNQWSYPLNLPLSWLGFPLGRSHILPESSQEAPFGDEFDYASLGPIKLGLGTFGEVAFHHRRSHTLLLTDTIVAIPEDPPEVVQLDPYPLLFHARDQVDDRVLDSPATRRQGWQRITLFAFYFRPSSVETIPLPQAIRAARQAPEKSWRALFGLYPFVWKPGWQESFAALQGGGQLRVAPILQTLILNRAATQTLDWVDRVASWDFQRIIPCHFQAPLLTNPLQFRRAFKFLEPCSEPSHRLPDQDFQLLYELEATLVKWGITPPRSPSDEAPSP